MWREKNLLTLSFHLFLDLINWFLFWFRPFNFCYMLLNYALSSLLLGIELPKYLASARTLRLFMFFGIRGYKTLNFWQWDSTDRIWPVAPRPWIKKPCFWACASQQGPSTLFLVNPASFISMYVGNYQSGIICRFFIFYICLPTWS